MRNYPDSVHEYYTSLTKYKIIPVVRGLFKRKIPGAQGDCRKEGCRRGLEMYTKGAHQQPLYLHAEPFS